jgi:hypothetical protein
MRDEERQKTGTNSATGFLPFFIPHPSSLSGLSPGSARW